MSSTALYINQLMYFSLTSYGACFKLAVTEHTIKNKHDIANTNNYSKVLTHYILYIPYVHTIIDYNTVYAIYH